MSLEIRGCGTALVTPFRKDGTLDLDALRRLVQFQLDAGIDFLVPCGTTGETPTLEHAEYLAVVRAVVQEVAGRVLVIAGVGGNNTRKVIDLAAEVRGLGVQGILSVAPYYNKPTQEGLYQHFQAMAESTDLPIIVYNVPSRTSSNIEPPTVQQMEVLAAVPPGFRVLSGDDAFTLPLMALGGVGVISVISNEIPGEMANLAHLMLEGKIEAARQLHFSLLPLMQVNFIETNPIPVKAALAMMGMIEEVYRLPMVPMQPENRAKLEKVLAAQGLLERR
jgi:4-hydroxy-tetrahydrodipicolinate synthase